MTLWLEIGLFYYIICISLNDTNISHKDTGSRSDVRNVVWSKYRNIRDGGAQKALIESNMTPWYNITKT